MYPPRSLTDTFFFHDVANVVWLRVYIMHFLSYEYGSFLGINYVDFVNIISKYFTLPFCSFALPEFNLRTYPG